MDAENCIICNKTPIECLEDDPFPEDHFHTFSISNEMLGFDPVKIANDIFEMEIAE